MKFEINDEVCLKSGIPGIISKCTPGIKKFKIQPAYVVEWVDGNKDVRIESELTQIYGLTFYAD